MEREITKKYSNGEITILWKPTACIHSTLCWRSETGLPDVFNPRLKPWIKPEGATTERIIQHVRKCPSGALSFYYNNELKDVAEITTDTKIEALANGPLLVYGNVLIKDSNGNETKRNNVTAFCRCGQSSNKPYCDGSHTAHQFKG